MKRAMHSRQRVFLMAALVCGLTGCLKWPNAEVISRQPGRVLFERAMSAVEQNRFDVANMTLRTLVNTYPDSEYASKATESWTRESRSVANLGTLHRSAAGDLLRHPRSTRRAACGAFQLSQMFSVGGLRYCGQLLRRSGFRHQPCQFGLRFQTHTLSKRARTFTVFGVECGQANAQVRLVLF